MPMSSEKGKQEKKLRAYSCIWSKLWPWKETHLDFRSKRCLQNRDWVSVRISHHNQTLQTSPEVQFPIRIAKPSGGGVTGVVDTSGEGTGKQWPILSVWYLHRETVLPENIPLPVKCTLWDFVSNTHLSVF